MNTSVKRWLAKGAGTAAFWGVVAACATLSASQNIPKSAQAPASFPTATYAVEDLGVLYPGGNYGGPRAYAINASGTAVGYDDGGPCTLNAFVWDGTMQGVPDAGACSFAGSINASGHVAGSLDHSGGGGCYRAFRLVGGIMTDLPAQPANTPDHDFRCANGLGINDADIVVGNIVSNLCSNCSGWELREAAHINDIGQIVGYGSSSPTTIHAFRFAGSSITDLGIFLNGGISYALGINNSGVVVGAAYRDASGVGNYEAAVYKDQVGTMQNLNDLIPTSSGWLLKEATAINDSGQIVGWGLPQR